MQAAIFHKNLPVIEPDLGYLNFRDTFLNYRSTPFIVRNEFGFSSKLEEFKIPSNLESLDIFLFEILSPELIELKQIEHYVETHQLKNVTVYTREFGTSILESQFKNFKILCLDIFTRWVTYPENITFDHKINSIDRKFHCSNWKYNSNRHLIMSYICSYNGYYSWYFHCPLDMLKDSWIDFNLFDQKTLTQIENGSKKLENTALSIDYPTIKQVKIKSKNTARKLPVSIGRYLNSYETNFYKFNFSNFEQSIINSGVAIINETNFEINFSNFTEKTLRSIALLTPFVIVGPPFTLKYLKELGFLSFDKWWDESYDIETNHTKRILKIFQVIDSINSKSLEELKVMYNEMKPLLIHNQTRLSTYRYDSTVLS